MERLKPSRAKGVGVSDQINAPSYMYSTTVVPTAWLTLNLPSLLQLYRVRYILNVTREIDNFYPEEFKYLNIRYILNDRPFLFRTVYISNYHMVYVCVISY